MAISEPYELDGVTVGATELSIVSGTTTLQTITDDGIYYPWLDPVPTLAKGDEYKFRIYEKVKSTGTKRVAVYDTIKDIQVEPRTYPGLMLLHGWDMTLQKLLGVDRAWDASIRAVTGAGLTERNVLNAVTVGATELSVVSGTTTLQTIVEAGFYQLWVDAFTMTKTEEYLVRIYEAVEGTGGIKRQIFEVPLKGVQSELTYSPVLLLKNGWDMTLQKVVGTDRALDASIRKVA